MQRLLDIFFSGIAIVCLSPLLAPIACVLRITGEGEVFYKQIRVGRNGAPFNLIKFASMLKDSPNLGNGEITVKNDPEFPWESSCESPKLMSCLSYGTFS